ncbi:hypothetical protein ACH5RR_041368 [Cinchona calisaya]|uniref:Uncharacterized protein n=1 Tax=Cinchona calisaya TaxID=153742 RepID=A0ABD2XTI3_9GENT
MACALYVLTLMYFLWPLPESYTSSLVFLFLYCQLYTRNKTSALCCWLKIFKNSFQLISKSLTNIDHDSVGVHMILLALRLLVPRGRCHPSSSGYGNHWFIMASLDIFLMATEKPS